MRVGNTLREVQAINRLVPHISKPGFLLIAEYSDTPKGTASTLPAVATHSAIVLDSADQAPYGII